MLVTIEFYRIEFCSKEKGCETSATIEPGNEKYKLRGLEPYTEYQVGFEFDFNSLISVILVCRLFSLSLSHLAYLFKAPS